MPPRTLPGIGLRGFWDLGEDGWNDEHDEDQLKLSVLVQLVVLSRTTELPGSPVDGDVYIVPSAAGSNADEIAIRDDGAWVYLVPQAGWTAYVVDDLENVQFDGSGWAGNSFPYDVPVSFAGTPTASQLIGKTIIVRDVEFEPNFSGSAGHVGTNPTAAFDIDVKDDGTSIGTISISTGGVFTFATSGSTSKMVAAGSRMEFVADSGVDATIADIAATLQGVTRSGVREMVVVFSDDFDRANANLESSAVSSGGGTWLSSGLVTGSMQIVSNQLSCMTTDAGGKQYYYDTGSTDHRVTFKILNTTANSFVTGRMFDNDNYVGVRISGSNIQAYNRVAASFSSFYDVNHGVVSGDVIAFEIVGQDIEFFKNGVSVGTSTIGPSLTSGTRVGVHGRQAVQNPFIDDFEVMA